MIATTAMTQTATPPGQPAGFLFTTFRGEKATHSEQVHFALSRDGREWHALNGGRPVLATILGTKGARDPFVIRSHDGKKFFLLATDLSVFHDGDWTRAVREGSRSILVWESPDLVNWSAPRQVPIAPKDAGCAWAPEAIYDKDAGDYLVYWASTTKGDDFSKQRIWAARTKDFASFGEPFVFIDKPHHVIDTTIVHDGTAYYRFSKDDEHKSVTLESAAKLAGPWKSVGGFSLGRLVGYEGPACFPLAARTDGTACVWCLILDHYAEQKGYEPFITHDLAGGKFETAESFSFPYPLRHGSVLPITEDEYVRLEEKWGPAEASVALDGMHNNPVIKGYYADPDIMFSEKTGRFHLYPTTDGVTDWNGSIFKMFSSDDLVHWREDGVILDLATDVSWANRQAWAPAVVERKTPEGYRYYFYFSAETKIGVAVADDPAGPFKDSGKPLISSLPPGVKSGQQIDPDVFHDPQSGKYFLYWGNQYLAVAELADDMLSIKEDTLRVITPDKTFREGITVFFRGGRYYFLWSEDDTRSEDYRVRYATSVSPLGPLEIPEDNLVMAKDPAAGIFATGHNTVIQVPGRDEWYIVYHRFVYPHGIELGRDAGYHREVCIDKMEFDENGAIRRVQPTHTGIAPLTLKGSPKQLPAMPSTADKTATVNPIIP